MSHTGKIASVRKSVLGMLYGNDVMSGKIDLDKTVKQLDLDDKRPFLPIERKATLVQLLASRSGIYLQTGNGDQKKFLPPRGSEYPGSYYIYNNWDFDAAGVAFEKQTGKDIYRALQTDLAAPLGMQDYLVSKQKKNYSPESLHPEYAMYLSTRDMARLGLLMLDYGVWNGKQIVPGDWVRYMTTLITPFRDVNPTGLRNYGEPERWGYGLLWWVWDEPAFPGYAYIGFMQGAYSATGTGGTSITVLPAKDMVVVHQVDIDKDYRASVSPSSYIAILSMSRMPTAATTASSSSTKQRGWYSAAPPVPEQVVCGVYALIRKQALLRVLPIGRPAAADLSLIMVSFAPLSFDPTERCNACRSGLPAGMDFTMAFQPILDFEARNLFAYEALVRGPGQQSAASVLALVEGENVYAFDRACRVKAIQLASRLDLQSTSASLSINFIPGAIYRPEVCIQTTLETAALARLPLERIIFEVTEGEQVHNPEHLKSIFTEYRRIGFRTAIDDFGAGYAGLNLLADFQPDIVKLDMALTRDIDSRKVSRRIVRAMVDLCAEIGIAVVAEGIETTGEPMALRDSGVKLFQGYLLGRPAVEMLPKPAFPASEAALLA